MPPSTISSGIRKTSCGPARATGWLASTAPAPGACATRPVTACLRTCPSITAAWDASGRLWVGAVDGLFRLEGKRFVPVLAADGRSLGEVDDLLATSDGTVWIASSDRGPLRWDGKEIKPLPLAAGVEARSAARIYRDADGTDLVQRLGTICCDGMPRARRWCTAGIGQVSQALHRDRQGTWWTGGTSGLQRKAAGSIVVYRQADGLASDDVRAIAPDSRGALWVATDGGLSRFEEEVIQVLSTKDGLPTNTVTRIAIDPRGTVWFTCAQSGARRGCPLPLRWPVDHAFRSRAGVGRHPHRWAARGRRRNCLGGRRRE